MSKMRVIKKNLEIDMMSSSSSSGGGGDNDDEETQNLTTFSSSSSLQVTDDDYPPQHDNDAIIFSQHQQNQRRRHHHIFRIKNIKNVVIIIAALLLLIVMGGLLISSNSSSSDSDDDDSSSSSGALKIDDTNKMYIKRNSNNNIIKIACAGDSLTLGSFGGTEPGGDYPSHLRNKLDLVDTKKGNNNNFDIHNFGRNGATAFSGIPPSYNATEQFQNSLDFNSDIYLLMLGSNDLSSWYDFDDREQKFIQDMEWIINKVRESSSLSSSEEEDQTTTNTPIRNKPRIILAKPPWVKRESRPDGTKIDIIQQEEMPILERLAIELDGLTLVDMYSVTVGHNEYYQPDEIHLISDGYNILANVWKDAILCDNNNICEIGEDCNTCPNDCQINCPP